MMGVPLPRLAECCRWLPHPISACSAFMVRLIVPESSASLPRLSSVGCCRFFPPLVTGTIILGIGTTLMLIGYQLGWRRPAAPDSGLSRASSAFPTSGVRPSLKASAGAVCARGHPRLIKWAPASSPTLSSCSHVAGASHGCVRASSFREVFGGAMGAIVQSVSWFGTRKFTWYLLTMCIGTVV